VVLSGWPGSAAGAGAAEPAVVGEAGASAWLDRYRVVPECPDATSFRGWVESRSSSTAAVASDVRIGVRIERAGDGGPFTGVIDVTDATARTTRRSVEGTSCSDVAQALSLIAALGLELRGGRAAPIAPEPALPALPVTVAAGAKRTFVAPGSQQRKDGFEVGAALIALAHSAAAPDVALGAGAVLTFDWRRGAPWQPSVWVGAYRAPGGEVRFAGGDARARFELFAAQALACPLRFPERGAWGLRPCVVVELGRVTGTSTGAAVVGATTRSGMWASGGVGVRAEAEPWGPLRLSVLGTSVVPLARHDFSFSPDATLAFQVPALGFLAAAYLGVAF
jgi:hypothetical protein